MTDHEYAPLTKHGTTIADGRHVSIEEAEAAQNTDNIDVEENDWMPSESWKPTKKWIAALCGSVASIAASWIVTGAFDDVERGMVATALVTLVAAYFKSNDYTPGGVPQ